MWMDVGKDYIINKNPFHKRFKYGRVGPHLIITRGQFWPSGILIACVCVCVRVCVCVNHLLVRAITWDPFKLGSPNLDQKCTRHWLRSQLFFFFFFFFFFFLGGGGGGGNWHWPSKSNLTSKSEFTPFWACPDQNPFKLRSPNLDQRWKIAWWRSL